MKASGVHPPWSPSATKYKHAHLFNLQNSSSYQLLYLGTNIFVIHHGSLREFWIVLEVIEDLADGGVLKDGLDLWVCHGVS